ncbi:recombinase family protein [Falsigemmobacter intermedius]|uniref:Recombinase family protein n=1 Tax=Falsigemmobacter intermedius TaxID=1553448 RepID=A0A3S3WF52_9RHOB|nr:recombinase family protein [Falsigemmobacter intermedius]RWY37348.1 recombinase family protein [Falsigemmobacter intermedius]
MQTIFYARVSTLDQTVDHQVTQAKEAGFVLDRVVADEGVSGISTLLRDRPQGRRLFDMLRDGDVLVVRWIDRLGRNYVDITRSMRDFLEMGVTIKTVISGMTFPAKPANPIEAAMRDATLAVLAALAEAEVTAKAEAQKAGIAHARAYRPTAYLGRKPTFTKSQVDRVIELHGLGHGPSEIAKATELKRQTVHRIIANPTTAAEAVAKWKQSTKRQ